MPHEQLFTTKDILSDSLQCEKHLASSYNIAATEANSDALRNDFLNILLDEQKLHAEVYKAMSQRGLYKVSAAQSADIAQAQQKFLSGSTTSQMMV